MERVDFDDVHMPVHPEKPVSGFPSPLRSWNIQPMSGWLTCTSFSLAPSQRASRSIWIAGSSSDVGAPLSWVLGLMTSGKAFWWFSGNGRPVSSIPTQVAIRFSAPR